MYGRQVTIRDLSLLMMDLDSNLSFDEAYDQVTDLLSQHPNGDSAEVRAMLEFEMVEALMEAEVRDEEDLMIEGVVRAARHGIIEQNQIPEELSEKVANRMQFQEEYAAEIIPLKQRDQKWYLVVTYDADITEDQHQEILSIVDDLNSNGHQLYLKYSPSDLKIFSPHKIHDTTGPHAGHYPNSVFPNFGNKWPHLTNPFKRLGFRSEADQFPSMHYGDHNSDAQEKYQEMLDEWDLDDDPPSFEEWVKQEEEYDRRLQEYEDSQEYTKAIEYAAESHPKNYMVRSDIARIVNSAERLDRLQSMFSDYDEWFKSQLSVAADTLDGLADYLEDQESYIMGQIQKQDESEYRRQMMSAESNEKEKGNIPKPSKFLGISYRSLLL